MSCFNTKCQTSGCRGKITIDVIGQHVSEHRNRLVFEAKKEYKRCKKCNSNYSIHGPGIQLTKLS